MQCNALTVLGIKHAAPGKYNDGQGLWLRKRRVDAGSWFLRFDRIGKRREMGLGPWPDVSIAEARDRAADARRKLRDNIDPIDERAAARRRDNCLSVEEAIKACFAARQAELKADGEAGRWMSPLNVHLIPQIGNLPITDIDQHELVAVLKPIWHEKPEAAAKALGRINLTLNHAAALGLDVDLQAVMKARALLGKQRHTKSHIPSLPYQDLPAFYRSLCQQKTCASAALRMLILTAARTSEVIQMRFSEIENRVWTLPPDRTKTQITHRIPLSAEALEIVSVHQGYHSDFVFAGRRGRALSNMAMLKLMKDRGMQARPHGFRATFRTWVEEQTDTPFEVKEMALGHTVGNSVVRAYQRSDLLSARSELMQMWAEYCSNGRGIK